MTVDHQILEHSVTEVDYSLFHVNWVPSSPRFVTCGSSLAGEGFIKTYGLASKGINEVNSCKRKKAIRCGTFESSSLEDRYYVTGDFGGNLSVWDLEDIDSPIEEVNGAHSDMINCITGDRETGNVVTGGRDGQVRIWDRRDLKQCAIKIVGDKCHDVWTVTTKDNQICAGYSNGDIRMFDIRTTDKVTWETNFGAGGATSLYFMPDKRLAGGGAGGGVTVWDLLTRHKTRGYTRTDRKVDSSCVWSVNPSPDDENIIVVTLGSGGVQLLKFNPPGHRVMIGSDGINVGTPGDLRPVANVQCSDRPITSWHWSNDRPGLGIATGLDQKIRVTIVTNITKS